MRTLLLLCAVAGFLVLADTARAQGTRAVVEKAIKAEGGADKLNKLTCTRAKARGTIQIMGQGVAFTSDAALQMPDKMRNEMVLDVMGNKVTVIQLLNGGKGWLIAAGIPQDMPDALLQEFKEEMHVTQVEKLTPLLDDKVFMLSPLPEIKVNGHGALGVKVTAKGHKDISLYFDTDTGLVVKTQRRSLDPVGNEVDTETYYSDFKDFDGLKQPAKILVHQDGKKYTEIEVTEMKFPDKLEESLFMKP